MKTLQKNNLPKKIATYQKFELLTYMHVMYVKKFVKYFN